MAWRFNETVPLVLTRDEASEVYEALKLYSLECGDVPAASGGTVISNVLARMKRHTEQRAKQ